jgi:PAS domain S-box-containing protein
LDLAVETDKKNFLASLIDAETLYQDAPCGYLSLLPDGTIIKVNQTLLRLLQFSEDELVYTKKFPELISKGGNIHYEMIFKPLVTMNGSVKELSYDIIRKDRTVFSALLSASVVKDEQNKVVAINAVLTDNTDRKHYERELLLARKHAENEKRTFESLADLVPEMIWTADAKGQIDYVNERFSHYFKLSNRKFELSNILSRIHMDDRELFTTTWARHIHSGEDLHIELRLRHEQADYKWHLVKAIAYREEDAIIKWFGSCTNIDQHILALRQKDEFISIASHELKTPLTSLSGTLQLLDRMKDGPMTPIIGKMIGQANRAVKKINILIADLLNVSRLREGQLALHIAPCDMTALLMETVDQLSHEYSTALSVNCEEGLLVNADAVRIEQVITNFVNNALKYAPDSTRIVVAASRTDHAVRVTVSDEGPGIPADKLPHIFDRYFRVDDSGMKYTGLGLGLYICAEIIRRHGGQYGVDSELGKGSSFWFTLPLSTIS